MTNELMVLPVEEKALEAVFIDGSDFDPVIEKIREQAKDLPFDMTVKKNRDEIASFAYKIARSKSAVEKAGAAISAKYKELPKKIDASRRAYKEAFEALQAEVRQPLTEWEEKEKALLDFLTSEVDSLKALASGSANDHNASALTSMLDQLEAWVIGDNFYDFETEALRVKAAGIAALKEQIAIAEKREAEQVELEQLRQQAAEQAQKEREAQIAAEAKAAAELQAAKAIEEAERKEAQAKLDAELAEQRRIAQEKQAELDKIAAAEREKQAAENARIEEIKRAELERAKLEAEQAAREADKNHRAKINREALSSLVANCGLNDDQAKAVVTAIAKGAISNVSIKY